jgi:hypothetical protein
MRYQFLEVRWLDLHSKHMERWHALWKWRKGSLRSGSMKTCICWANNNNNKNSLLLNTMRGIISTDPFLQSRGHKPPLCFKLTLASEHSMVHRCRDQFYNIREQIHTPDPVIPKLATQVRYDLRVYVKFGWIWTEHLLFSTAKAGDW